MTRPKRIPPQVAVPEEWKHLRHDYDDYVDKRSPAERLREAQRPSQFTPAAPKGGT